MIGWAKALLVKTEIMATINRGLQIAYGVVLLLIAFQIGFSFWVVLGGLTLIVCHVSRQRLSRQDAPPRYGVYLLLLEFLLLIVLTYGYESDWIATLFLIYTASIILNYPPAFALPYIYIGYSIYLFLFAPSVTRLDSYLLNLVNFSLFPCALVGVRSLIGQRQAILALNQRLQSQAALSAEMTRLRERNRLAEALHDTIGHTLTSAIVSLEGVALLWEKRPAEAVTLLDSVREQLQAGLGDIRQTVRTLKTDTLAEHATLQASLRQLVARVSRQTTVEIDLDDQLTVTLLPIQEYVLYSLVREGITNALKHSQATRLQITLTAVAPEQIALTLADNGVGTDAFAFGFGLTHLEQKVTALGGILTIETAVGAGFRLQVLLPLAVDLLRSTPPAIGQKEATDDSSNARR